MVNFLIIDFRSKIGWKIYFFMGKFSSQEIESQYNLIKMLLAQPEKYKDAIDAIKKDIVYMPIELKKKLKEENITFWIKTIYLKLTKRI